MLEDSFLAGRLNRPEQVGRGRGCPTRPRLTPASDPRKFLFLFLPREEGGGAAVMNDRFLYRWMDLKCLKSSGRGSRMLGARKNQTGRPNTAATGGATTTEDIPPIGKEELIKSARGKELGVPACRSEYEKVWPGETSRQAEWQAGGWAD